jgi:hypothetical protein
MSAEGERRADAGSPAFGADEVENVLAHLQHHIGQGAADVAGGALTGIFMLAFPADMVLWPDLVGRAPSAQRRKSEPSIGCDQPDDLQASQRAGRSKPRNSTAHSLSRCDRALRTSWCDVTLPPEEPPV